jgi:hypothetical protein
LGGTRGRRARGAATRARSCARRRGAPSPADRNPNDAYARRRARPRRSASAPRRDRDARGAGVNGFVHSASRQRRGGGARRTWCRRDGVRSFRATPRARCWRRARRSRGTRAVASLPWRLRSSRGDLASRLRPRARRPGLSVEKTPPA